MSLTNGDDFLIGYMSINPQHVRGASNLAITNVIPSTSVQCCPRPSIPFSTLSMVYLLDFRKYLNINKSIIQEHNPSLLLIPLIVTCTKLLISNSSSRWGLKRSFHYYARSFVSRFCHVNSPAYWCLRALKHGFARGSRQMSAFNVCKKNERQCLKML